jgi:GntR family transcriptional regulator
LFIERRTFLEDGRVVEFTRSFYRGDAYVFVAELHSV